MTLEMDGGCLCGAVQFTICAPTDASAHCHCSFCRRAHGAALVTWLVVPEAQFKMSSGEDELRWFQSSPQSRRGFCSVCGSSMFFRSTMCDGEIHVTRANIEGDVDIAPGYHCFVDEKVDWLKIDDELEVLRGDSPELAHYGAIAKS